MTSVVPANLREEYRAKSKSELVERLFMAEEVCSTMLLVMHFDMIPAVALDQGTRDLIANPMQRWSERCLPPEGGAA